MNPLTNITTMLKMMKAETTPSHSTTAARSVIMVVGATGSLGKPLVADLQRSSVPLRLFFRSESSWERSGITATDETELVVCASVNDPDAFLEEWFTDLKLVICLARPRSLKTGDVVEFERTMMNLFEAVCQYQVPQMIMVGRPYVSSFEFGMTPHTRMRMRMEDTAIEVFNQSSSSRLTIVRITEMSEIGHLLEIATIVRVWICLRGRNPRLQPISARDFASAITLRCAAVVDNDEETNVSKEKTQELLMGGPKVYTFGEIRQGVASATGMRLPVFPVPVSLVRLLLATLRFLKLCLPRVEGIETVLILAVTAMAGDSVTENHETFGKDRLEDYLDALATHGDTTYVHRRIGVSRQTTTQLAPEQCIASYQSPFVSPVDAWHCQRSRYGRIAVFFYYLYVLLFLSAATIQMLNPISHGWECHLPNDETANEVYFAWLIRMLSTFMFGLYLLAGLVGPNLAILAILTARMAAGTLFSLHTKRELGEKANAQCWDGDIAADAVAVFWPIIMFALLTVDMLKVQEPEPMLETKKEE